MILKSLSRSGGFGDALRYVNQPDKVGTPLLWNLETNDNDIGAIEKEFLNNSRYVRLRKRGILLYHDIISLSDLDRDKVNSEMLIDMAREYLEMRAPGAIAYAMPHFDSDNPHIHVLISANRRKSGKKIRLSKKDFARIKLALESWQRERYPQLTSSVVEHIYKGDRTHETRGEREGKRRLQKERRSLPTAKEKVAAIVARSLAGSRSLDDFKERLLTHGLAIYLRRGKLTGVRKEDNRRKYRFSTLGLSEALCQQIGAWEKTRSRDEALEQIMEDKTQSFERDLYDETTSEHRFRKTEKGDNQ